MRNLGIFMQHLDNRLHNNQKIPIWLFDDDYIEKLSEMIANELKAVSEEEGAERWREFVDSATRHETRWKTKISSFFRQQKREALEKFDRYASISRAYKSKDINADDLINVPKWQVTFEEFGQLMLPEMIEERGKYEMGRVIAGVSFNTRNQRAIDFTASRAYRFSFETNKTTQDLLRTELSRGIEAGEGIPQLRKRVAGVFDFSEKYRTERIARTEVIRAYNFSAEEAWMQSGVVSAKQWFCAIGERTCPWCWDMHGKVIALGSNYFSLGDTQTVDGKTLPVDYENISYPPRHPNCRCTLIPIVQAIAQKTAEQAREEIKDIYNRDAAETDRLQKEAKRLKKEFKQALKLGDADKATLINKLLEDNARQSFELRWTQTQRMREVLYVNKKGFNLSAYKDASIQGAVADNVQKGLTEVSKLVSESLLDNLQLAPGMKRIQVRYEPGIRSFAQKLGIVPEGRMYLGVDYIDTICHEMGHIVEFNNPEILNKAKAFIKNRAGGRASHWLGNGFDKDEFGWNDELFIDVYIGKIYPDCTEVISMGLQYFQQDPYTLATKDAEYFDLIYNILRGIY